MSLLHDQNITTYNGQNPNGSSWRYHRCLLASQVVGILLETASLITVYACQYHCEDRTLSCIQQLCAQSVSDCDNAWCSEQSLSHSVACLATAKPISRILYTKSAL